MKKCIIIVIALFAIQTNAQKIKFESEVIDYGKITRGSDGTRFFKFKNVGDAPLNIKHALASSGGTIATTPKKPVFPGETGKIEVNFHTGRLGNFSQPITVDSDAKNKPRVVLTIKGNVIKYKL